MLVIVDMKTSNLRSIDNAIRKVGAEPVISSSAREVERASALILPGVGAFEHALDNLRGAGLVDVLRRRVGEDGVPLLGICLGMQVLADFGEENGEHEGLGLVAGRAVRLRPGSSAFRVPNIGWYSVAGENDGALFGARADAGTFYFVHSYHLHCDDAADVSATIEYGDGRVTAAVEKGNVFGVQFHPEKSQDDGLDLLAAFVSRLRGQNRIH